ncbi:hypothetical protein GCM10010359_30140 [Streptomyces morookaense]|uniref:Uncharacterized protein n=1 Tax=Streptomyces morookaense TaxID=1970 RepID=A0A7Y7B0Z7_STRMO|nr:hypothetical protein [Streptomyces morookaense]GHF26051.1 hypothetical protein GCM10010359_30140 [Streptomyces morookaense]
MITREDIGKRVRDTSGRVGILCDVIPDYEDPDAPRHERRKRPTAFLRPEGGAGSGWSHPAP